MTKSLIISRPSRHRPSQGASGVWSLSIKNLPPETGQAETSSPDRPLVADGTLFPTERIQRKGVCRNVGLETNGREFGNKAGEDIVVNQDVLEGQLS
jgi:hypothetical protein